MNRPGTPGSANWSWRFAWPTLGHDTARMLALVTAVFTAESGRGPIGLLRG